MIGSPEGAALGEDAGRVAVGKAVGVAVGRGLADWLGVAASLALADGEVLDVELQAASSSVAASEQAAVRTAR